MSQYRKALAALLLAVVQVAAYIIADPVDLPPWVVAAAGLVNTAAVYGIRNAPPPRHGPTERFGRQAGVGGFEAPTDQPPPAGP